MAGASPGMPLFELLPLFQSTDSLPSRRPRLGVPESDLTAEHLISWDANDHRAIEAFEQWSRSSPGSSPITTSPLYPERPIKPLPKRRLKSRLSPEQAESIVYPPAPSSGPLFSFPYGDSEKAPSVAGRQQPGEHQHTCSCGKPHPEESDDEDDGRAAFLQSSPTTLHYDRAQLNGRAPSISANGFPHPPPPPDSTASSADGYESFENTNNKKKRKIPLSERNGHHTGLSPELANMGTSNAVADPGSTDEGNGGGGKHYGSSSSQLNSNATSGTGISGAGRGRYSRSGRGMAERRPLGASTNGLNAYGNGAVGRQRRDWSGTASKSEDELCQAFTNTSINPRIPAPNPDGGIISAAIANAAEQPALTQEKGNENVSLLQQYSKSTPPKTKQFTFTCESDSSQKMVWPGQNGSLGASAPAQSTAPPASSVAGANRRGVSTQGTQTSPAMRSGQGASEGQHAQPASTTNQQQGQQARPPRPRRTAAKEYALAARQRRLQQEYTNYHNPPKREDIWICEFCEYESIFGTPPTALIRRYEEKDRKERKAQAERRRLLEKAKMKNKKNKKGAKAAKRTENTAQQNQPAPSNQRYDNLDNMPLPNDDLGDDFVDDYDDAMAAPPPPQDQMPGSYVNEYVDRPPLPRGAARSARGGKSGAPA